MPKEFIKETKVLGLRIAWNHFWHRRHLPLVGYLILVTAIIFALASNRTYYTTSEKQAKTEITQICYNSNQLRTILRKIIIQSETDIKKYVNEHILPKKVVDQAIKSDKHNINLLQNINC